MSESNQQPQQVRILNRGQSRAYVRELQLQRGELVDELSKLMHSMWAEQMARVVQSVEAGNVETAAGAWKDVCEKSFDQCGDWRKAFYSRQAERVLTVMDAVATLHRARAPKPLATREKCPACEMLGALFEVCMVCGGPCCDNCINGAKGKPVCMTCQLRLEKERAASVEARNEAPSEGEASIEEVTLASERNDSSDEQE